MTPKVPPPADSDEPWEAPPTESEAFAAPAHDPRDIITQHAFRVAPHVLGLPLATPRSRAIAIGVDVLLVVMLSKAGGVLLAMVVAVFAYSWARNRYRPTTRLGRGLSGSARLMIAMLVFSLVVSLLQPLWERYFPDEDDDTKDAPTKGLQLNGTSSVAFAAALAGLHACPDADCREKSMQGLASVLQLSKSDRKVSLDALKDLADDATDDPAEQQQLHGIAAKTYDEMSHSRKAQAAAGADEPAKTTDGADAASPARRDGEDDADRPPQYSLLKQLLGALDDLGLSAGWAAVYFTLFTTLWAGQTPGKRLMRIRVIHLSGKPLSYWNSFGRYGGYAAGLTTGLLGFLQIFWDPNRQAVQDQLSFTAVIRDVESAVALPSKVSK